jgi:hypothetical protein
MTLENQRNQFTVTNENSKVTLRGELSFNETEVTINMSGSVNALNGDYLGSFFFNFRTDHTIDKSFNSVKDASLADVEEMVNTTIAEVREHFNV